MMRRRRWIIWIIQRRRRRFRTRVGDRIPDDKHARDRMHAGELDRGVFSAGIRRSDGGTTSQGVHLGGDSNESAIRRRSRSSESSSVLLGDGSATGKRFDAAFYDSTW